MKKLTKKNIAVFERMYWEHQLGEEHKYNSFFELFQDFIIWHIEEDRSKDVCDAWLKYLQYHRICEHTCIQIAVIADFIQKQNSNFDANGFLGIAE